MERKSLTIKKSMVFFALCVLFLGCPNETEQSIRITVQNNSSYKLSSVKAGGVIIE